jgi:hypothetical protein
MYYFLFEIEEAFTFKDIKYLFELKRTQFYLTEFSGGVSGRDIISTVSPK